MDPVQEACDAFIADVEDDAPLAWSPERYQRVTDEWRQGYEALMLRWPRGSEDDEERLMIALSRLRARIGY